MSIDRSTVGHVNDSFIVQTTSAPWFVQRVNAAVFADPDAVTNNAHRVSEHLRARLDEDGVADPDRRTLTFARTGTGELTHHDGHGGVWRCSRYIERTTCLQNAQTTDHARAIGGAVASFQRRLNDGTPPEIVETIPDFHNTRARLEAFKAALRTDPLGRAAEARPVSSALLVHADLAGILLDANLPRRIAHNDAKASNILFDADTNEALCLVDLDTVMPGSALFDVGDMIRSIVPAVDENEPDTSRVRARPEMLKALLDAYKTEATFLTDKERSLLPTAGHVITYEQALRFATDHLLGDPYYGAATPTQNRDRAANQLKLLNELRQLP